MSDPRDTETILEKALDQMWDWTGPDRTAEIMGSLVDRSVEAVIEASRQRVWGDTDSGEVERG